MAKRRARRRRKLRRHLNLGINHISCAIDHFTMARQWTSSRWTDGILTTNIDLLRVIRQDKKRLRRRIGAKGRRRRPRRCRCQFCR